MADATWSCAITLAYCPSESLVSDCSRKQLDSDSVSTQSHFHTFKPSHTSSHNSHVHQSIHPTLILLLYSGSKSPLIFVFFISQGDTTLRRTTHPAGMFRGVVSLSCANSLDVPGSEAEEPPRRHLAASAGVNQTGCPVVDRARPFMAPNIVLPSQ